MEDKEALLKGLQAEYNQLCAQRGHNDSQVEQLQRDNELIKARIQKLINKSKNIPGGKNEPSSGSSTDQNNVTEIRPAEKSESGDPSPSDILAGEGSSTN